MHIIDEMTVRLFLFIGFSTFSQSIFAIAAKPTASDICASLLETSDRFSIVLKQDGSHDISINAVTPRDDLFDSQSFARIMSRFPSARAIIRGLPELGKLEWTKIGQNDFVSYPKGLFGKIIRYRIHADGSFALELKLGLGLLNEGLVRNLVDFLIVRKVPAAIMGQVPSFSVDRLDLGRRETREALNDFFQFLQENQSNPAYIAGVNQSDHI